MKQPFGPNDRADMEILPWLLNGTLRMVDPLVGIRTSFQKPESKKLYHG